MASKQPFFLTGGNARILLNNKTVAYATSVNYRISVKHASPRVLGRFEIETIQPLSYDVTGSLSIIRYGRGLQSFFGEGAPNSVTNKGNSIGSYSLASAGGVIGAALGLPTVDGQWDGRADEAFNPSRFFQSMMFNIEIRQIGLVGAQTTSKIGLVGIQTQPKDEIPVVVLRDCRFEDMQFKLSKRGVATIDFTFRARYADDDTFIARKSGVGQEFS